MVNLPPKNPGFNGAALWMRAFTALHEKPYDFPTVSCLTMIEMLSAQARHFPDYSEWKSLSEAKAFAKILAMGNDSVGNYIECHKKVLQNSWSSIDGEPSNGFCPGDIAFFRVASGTFIDRASGDTVIWHSDMRFPATCFPDHEGKFWMVTTNYGLKVAQKAQACISTFRRHESCQVL